MNGGVLRRVCPELVPSAFIVRPLAASPFLLQLTKNRCVWVEFWIEVT